MNRFGLSRFSCQGLFSTRGALARKRLQTRLQPVQLHGPIKDIKNNCSCDIAHPPGAQRPGIIINPSTDMAWRPYANLIDGELNNDTPGKVTGWMRFFRRDMTPLRVSFDLVGDFREDIHGRRIRLTNPHPSDENIALDRKGSSHPFRAGLLATSPPACHLAPGPRNSPRDSLRKMRSSGTRSGFQQPSGKSAGRCGPSSTADTSNRATDTLPMWTIPTSSGTRKRTVGWYWSWTLYKWRSSIIKEGQPMRREAPSELHPVKGEAAMFDILDRVLDTSLRRRGKRRDQRTSRKR